MDLNEIAVFAKVVQAGSFRAASRALGMPKSTVSRKVADLEARLGARLLQRTTRTLGLTDVGAAFFQHCARIVEAVDEAERAVTQMQGRPRGRLRIATPPGAAFLAPVVSAFLKRYPETQVEMHAAQRAVRLVEEGFDVAVRAGPEGEATLIARHLARFQSVLVASPAYLSARGAPEQPNHLAQHDCIVLGTGNGDARWPLTSDGRTVEVAVSGRLVVNELDVVHRAALDGIGIARLPLPRGEDELHDGRLVRVLPDWTSPETPLRALYPSTRQLSPKVRAFVDLLVEADRDWFRG